MGFFFQWTLERVRNSHGKRDIGVGAIEVLLYISVNIIVEMGHGLLSIPSFILSGILKYHKQDFVMHNLAYTLHRYTKMKFYPL